MNPFSKRRREMRAIARRALTGMLTETDLTLIAEALDVWASVSTVSDGPSERTAYARELAGLIRINLEPEASDA